MGVVVDFGDSGKRKASIEGLSNLVKADLDRVNKTIIENMQSPVALIPQLAGHLIAAGGKRLRPMLTLGAAALCGYEGERHVKLAACVEFIHTATLLHDDVVDESELRRGQESANAVWGNQASVLVGDFLFSRSFQLMTADGSIEVMRILSEASAVIAEGEVQQLITTNDTETDESAYLEVIRGKTAKLFAAAAEVGAVVAERPKAEQQALESYGMNLGIAFQLVDDVLDYSAQQEKLGKNVGDDFQEGKITLPVILAFRRGDDEERAFWRRTLQDLDQQEGDLAHAQALMAKHNTLADSLDRARHYAAIARDALGLFDDGDAKQALVDVVDFCVERAY
ncbi:polyprenyl synthetase family protein [Nisaea acidiphila]|uniref:Octaprenyl diphosphate synthase n=1 Tax=Nisaea acidiphila TaxID=1862145 RepID=A0A9J7AXZ3_9PROT|nr:polyprenyl synthetase family protein [Nisaea acidiphila]UUX51132.1 polyprenyl synthetase family protein [Nisaea acidiphila]